MSITVVQRLKDTLADRHQALLTWLRQSPEQKKKTIAGPLGETALEEELQVLGDALRKAEENTLGLCDVCHDYVDTSRLEMDFTASVCIEHLSDAERARLESDLELSQKVQRALLPHELPAIIGMDLAAFSQPAQIVGGDYFDFLRFKDGSHGLVIADVQGKGMPASLLMASFQASLRIIVPESAEPAEAMQRINVLFRHNIRLTKFVTVFLARYDEQMRELVYCNAGHNPPMLARANGQIELLRPTAAAIGLAEQTRFDNSTVHLLEGDRLLLYTDGVVETRNNVREEFGESGLQNLLRNAAGLSSSGHIAALKESLRTFSGSTVPSDDTTVISIRMIPR
jgi:sigma-B regulation protein RsbU (phosphoserine phosphatase)